MPSAPLNQHPILDLVNAKLLAIAQSAVASPDYVLGVHLTADLLAKLIQVYAEADITSYSSHQSIHELPTHHPLDLIIANVEFKDVLDSEPFFLEIKRVLAEKGCLLLSSQQEKILIAALNKVNLFEFIILKITVDWRIFMIVNPEHMELVDKFKDYPISLEETSTETNNETAEKEVVESKTEEIESEADEPLEKEEKSESDIESDIKTEVEETKETESEQESQEGEIEAAEIGETEAPERETVEKAETEQEKEAQEVKEHEVREEEKPEAEIETETPEIEHESLEQEKPEEVEGKEDQEKEEEEGEEEEGGEGEGNEREPIENPHEEESTLEREEETAEKHNEDHADQHLEEKIEVHLENHPEEKSVTEKLEESGALLAKHKATLESHLSSSLAIMKELADSRLQPAERKNKNLQLWQQQKQHQVLISSYQKIYQSHHRLVDTFMHQHEKALETPQLNQAHQQLLNQQKALLTEHETALDEHQKLLNEIMTPK